MSAVRPHGRCRVPFTGLSGTGKSTLAAVCAMPLAEFSGIDDPFEASGHPNLVIDTTEVHPGDAALRVFGTLERLGHVQRPAPCPLAREPAPGLIRGPGRAASGATEADR